MSRDYGRTDPRSRASAYLVATLAAVVWGFELVLVRYLVKRMPFPVAGYLSHFITAALLLAGMLVARREPMSCSRFC